MNSVYCSKFSSYRHLVFLSVCSRPCAAERTVFRVCRKLIVCCVRVNSALTSLCAFKFCCVRVRVFLDYRCSCNRCVSCVFLVVAVSATFVCFLLLLFRRRVRVSLSHLCVLCVLAICVFPCLRLVFLLFVVIVSPPPPPSHCLTLLHLTSVLLINHDTHHVHSLTTHPPPKACKQNPSTRRRVCGRGAK